MIRREIKIEDLNINKLVANLILEYRNKDIFIDSGRVNCKFIDTGNLALNYIMSGSFDEGLPEGQVTEIYGEASSGKSLLLYNIIANFQKKYPNGIVILDDTENAYVEYLGSTLNIDANRLIKLTSSTVEEHAAVVALGGKVPIREGDEIKDIEVEPILDKLIKAGIKEILIAIDSIAVLSTRHELNVGLEKPDMSKAKTLKALLRLITPIIKRYNVTYIITNHLIQMIGSIFPMKIAPGGGGIVYQSSIRLGLMPHGKLKTKETNSIVGVISEVTTTKNRFAPPFRKCDLEIWFSKGMSKYSGLVSLLVNLGVIRLISGGWYETADKSLKFQSKDIEHKWVELRKLIINKNILQREQEIIEDKLNEEE